MPFKTSYNMALGQPSFALNGVDTLARVAIGTIVKGYDDTLGEAEFMYLPGVAGLLAGDHCWFDLLPGAPSVTRSLAATTANSGLPTCVALTAVPAGSYGWFQISGVAAVNVAAGNVAGRVYDNAVAGQLSSTALAGAQLLGARFSTAIGTPTASQAYMTLTRPAMQSQIT